ncbi:MAG: biliverdin-producing heme oxygenase [Phenylobacterium sp.]|uniref:biliverdin-producing heme oxygenase n=1 Tax=Phenylobacterium sp. TaxID=1871053 RepID=UPI001A40E497|nr:biliverdin-producing heme oxygenase [Phenylobacterium sp.]MBL8772825.1 biliverdin-producing heme oxygenase [Phenylobacterium sp.]
MTCDTLRRVRDATREPHQRLERRLDILRRIACADQRRELVGRFGALHVDAETALAPWLSGMAELDFEARRRSPRLARDMAVLGLRAPSGGGEPIRLRNVGEALGLMYVLEGSTLGGRVIRRHVEGAGGDLTGLSFLDPYGRRAGERWRGFLSVLSAAPQADDVVAGSVAGFEHVERRLCGRADA